MKIMSVIKLIPFYLFLCLNCFAVVLKVISYFDLVDYEPYARCSCETEDEHFTIEGLANLIVLVFSTVYAWRKRNESLVKAYIAVSIYISIFLIKYVYYRYFYF